MRVSIELVRFYALVIGLVWHTVDWKMGFEDNRAPNVMNAVRSKHCSSKLA